MWLDTIGAGALPFSIVSGEGCQLTDEHGRTYWDFYGGHAVTLLGQGHPGWIRALTTQARELTFFTTLAPVPSRDRAAAKLCAWTGYDYAWFVNSGAEANEAALKIVRKATGRGRIIAFEGGFHGRTMGALGATWGYRDQHQPPYGETTFVPWGDLAAVEAALDDTVAGVIVEPVQGIAGVRTPPEGFLTGLADAVHAAGGLVIADEVQAGSGRMGVPLAQTLYGLRGDVTTLGKGLGGGFPVSAVLVDQALADTVAPGDHGSTFGGAPLACAAVEATLDILAAEDLLLQAQHLGQWMKEAFTSEHCTVRGAGAWAGLVLDRPAKPVMLALRDAGFLVGTAGDPNVLRLAPPATMPHQAVVALAEALNNVLTPQSA